MKLRNLICLAAVLAGSVGTAQAIPVAWEAEYDPADFRLSAPNQISFPLDITKDGYRPGLDTISSAELLGSKSSVNSSASSGPSAPGWTTSIAR